MLSQLKQTSGRLIQSSVHSEMFRYIAHIVLSIAVGLLAGAGGILFHSLLGFMGGLFEYGGLFVGSGWSEYLIILIPVAGAAVTSAMTFIAPEIAARRGVVSVIKAVIVRGGVIPLKETLFHLAAPIISIGTGLPLGPEGPSAKIGGGSGSLFAQVLKLGKRDTVMFTVAGAGAAISAVFNAPIAGVFFGIEVVLQNDMRNRALSSLIIASVVADILSRAVLGGGKAIVIPSYTLGGLEAYPFFLGLALFCGLAALVYFWLSNAFGRLYADRLAKANPWLRLMPPALLFGLALVKYPMLFGVGYDTISEVLAGGFGVADAAALLALKLVFIALLIKAGGYGGTFAPSMWLGAFVGFVFASLVNMLFDVSINTVAFALVGMGGVLAAVNSIPMTAILLVFEMTNDYRFVLPLMLVSIISYLVVMYAQKGTVYSQALSADGIDLSIKSEMDILGKIHVRSILRSDMETVDYRTPFRKLTDIIISSRYGDVVVVDGTGRLAGLISIKDVRQALIDNDLADLLIANDLVVHVPAVTEDAPLTAAIQRMDRNDIDIIPVTDEDGKFIGIITHGDIILSYEKMLGAVEDKESIM